LNRDIRLKAVRPTATLAFTLLCGRAAWDRACAQRNDKIQNIAAPRICKMCNVRFRPAYLHIWTARPNWFDCVNYPLMSWSASCPLKWPLRWCWPLVNFHKFHSYFLFLFLYFLTLRDFTSPHLFSNHGIQKTAGFPTKIVNKITDLFGRDSAEKCSFDFSIENTSISH
jgi:hypothetical protein